jgi:hypothetical protein
MAILSLIIAIYAAILSTINLYTQRRDKQGRLVVKISTGITTLAPGVASDALLFLEAANPAHKTVVVNIPGFILPDGREMVIPYPQSNVVFPFKLEPEHDCKIWIDLKKIARQLHAEGFTDAVNLVGFYRDAVGRKHKSKKFKLNITTWL